MNTIPRRTFLELAALGVSGTAYGAAAQGSAPAAAEISPLDRLVDRAGNAETDEERLAIVKEMAALPGLGPDVRRDVDALIAQIEQWMTAPIMFYYSPAMRKAGRWDFGIAEDSPLYVLTDLYHVRMHIWDTFEYGTYWSHPDARRKRFDEIRPQLERLSKRFPGSRLLRMYLGEPWLNEKQYEGVPGAPEWAVLERRGLEGLADVVEWWIDFRMRENGEYGGGWEDDCEMWRSWAPVLIAFNAPKIVKAQADFSRALFSRERMAAGYTDHLTDVEHSAEESSDGLTPMMHLEPDNPEWGRRALRIAELARTVWTGVNERGFLQFKSTYFNASRVSDEPRKACDTVYHTKALQPVFLYWQRTGDPEIGEFLCSWLDLWVDAAARAGRGKPEGIIPSAVHWPEGYIGGLGEQWWDPKNHSDDPLYVWPSAMSQLLNALLQAHFMTGEDTYLEPIRSMARIRADYLAHRPEGTPEPGSAAWCGARLGGLRDILAKCKLLTGNTEFDALLAEDRGPYMAFRMGGDDKALLEPLRQTARALSINFPGFTSEVRYTDRVFRFPHMFAGNGLYPDKNPDIPIPRPDLLYAMATGDPGQVGHFPMNAVRWDTPPRDIAALVVDASNSIFEAKLFHFGENERPMAAEFYLLNPGKYTVTLSAGDGAPQAAALTVEGKRTRYPFVLPPRVECELRIKRAE